MIKITKAGIAVACTTAVFFAPLANSASGLTANVGVSHATNDNIFRQATKSQSDSSIIVSPELLYVKEFGKHQLSLGYKGESASYSSITNENYTDSTFNVDLSLDLSNKIKFDIKTSLKDGHETRGASGVDNTSDGDVNLLNENTISTAFSYGRDDSRAKVELDYSVINQDYTNNDLDSRDRQDTKFAGRLFYKLGAKTKVFVEAEQNNYGYINSTLDSNESIYYAGLRLDEVSKISGELKVGSFEKSFDTAGEPDVTGTAYKAGLTWTPKSFSRFNLESSQAPQESSSATASFTKTLTSLNWEHDINKDLTFKANVGQGVDDYTTARKDTLSDSGLGLSYKFRRWLDLDFNYSNSTKDSTIDTNDFTENKFTLTAKFLYGKK